MDDTSEDDMPERLVELFDEAMEVAIFCHAEVAIVVIPAEGERTDYSSTSSMVEEIVEKFKKFCYQDAMASFFEGTAESEPKETDAAELKSRKLLNNYFAEMSSDELTLLESQMNEGVIFILKRELELLREKQEQSRREEERLSMETQLLEGQIKEMRRYRAERIINSFPLKVSEGIDTAGALGS